LVDHVETFYREPMTPASGCPLAEVRAIEAELGYPLPVRVREFYLLFGRRPELWLMHRPLPLEELPANCGDDYLACWEECQGVYEWTLSYGDLGHPDPPVYIDQTEPCHLAFTDFVTHMLIHVDFEVRHDVGLEDLKPEVHGGIAVRAVPELLAHHYPERALVGPAGIEHILRWFGDTQTSLLLNTVSGEAAAWTVDAEAWERLTHCAGMEWTFTWVCAEELELLTPTCSSEPSEADLETAAREVPALVGLQVERAHTLAGTLGFLVSDREGEPSSTAPAGEILRQDPAPGNLLTGLGPVKVVTSLGAPRITLPDLVGLRLERVRSHLSILGLELGQVRGADAPSSTVVSCLPPAGAGVAPGTRVDLETEAAE